MSVPDTTDDHAGHLPAVEDWPRGFGEASWWPFIAAIGATGLYVGAALFLLGRTADPVVAPIVGPAVFLACVAIFLFGLFGWLYHAFVADFWRRGTSEHSAGILRFGMVLFLGTELATFGAGFAYYFFIRAGGWPPAGFEVPELLNTLVLANTIVLIASSITLHFAHTGLRKGKRRRFVGLLGVTLALGVIFLGGQVLEYLEFITQEDFTLTSGILGSAFFGLTGLHGLHVTMGAILLLIIFVRGLGGQYSPSRSTSVSTVSMYWHFVDAVWLFLVAVIYIGSAA